MTSSIINGSVIFDLKILKGKQKNRKRESSTSYLQIDISKYVKYKRDADRHIVNFINKNNMQIKTVIDTMAGRGVFTEYLLRINCVEKIIINDMAKDCYEYLKNKFGKNPIIKEITNRDFFDMNLERHVDLVVIDFNNFTWNKAEQVNSFLGWVGRNRDNFSYLLYTDSFYYSLKFLSNKDKGTVGEKYEEYLQRAVDHLCMELLTSYVYKNKNCSILLLKN